MVIIEMDSEGYSEEAEKGNVSKGESEPTEEEKMEYFRQRQLEVQTY